MEPATGDGPGYACRATGDGTGYACKSTGCLRVFEKAAGLARHVQSTGHDDRVLRNKKLQKPLEIASRTLHSYSFKAQVLRRADELESGGACDIGKCIQTEFPKVELSCFYR